jgi:hypothetical protein
MQSLKRISIVGAVVLPLLLVAITAEAQISLELQGGATFPTGDLNDYWNIGYTAGGTFLYELTPFVSLGVNLAYSGMGLDADKVKDEMDMDDWDISGGTATVFSACAEVRAHAGAMDMATLFAGAGFGLFHIGVTDIESTFEDEKETSTFDSEDQPGGYVHAGGAIPLSPMIKLGIKAQWTFYQMKNDDLKDMLEASEGRNFASVTAALIIGF